jgi:NADH-quinone oxidoreductase subunit L
MLMLVASNGCLASLFGWEAVGLVSYLLIGFWFNRSPQPFCQHEGLLVNRVGDFGFILRLH